ncbi:MAG: glycine cleavage system protein H [Betaproteobacteria bacterium]|nr:glycine cleavage system protein H [Betaproteobacteria bacterium]
MPHSAFHGFIPDDRLYCPRSEMWVQEIGEGEVRIGATAFGLFLAGEVIAFTAKPRGADVAIGRGMGTVESRKTVIAIHAPISFVQLEGNDAAEASPALVKPRSLRHRLDGAGPTDRLGRRTARAARWRGLSSPHPYPRSGGPLCRLIPPPALPF